MFEKIVRLFEKVDDAVYEAERMQYTVERAGDTIRDLKEKKRGGLGWVVAVIIIIAAVAYAFLS